MTEVLSVEYEKVTATAMRVRWVIRRDGEECWSSRWTLVGWDDDVVTMLRPPSSRINVVTVSDRRR